MIKEYWLLLFSICFLQALSAQDHTEYYQVKTKISADNFPSLCSNKEWDGDEIIDLEDWKDDLSDDIYYDLSKVKDDMLEDETEEEEVGMEVDEVVKMLRAVKCKPCPGLKSKPDCKIAHDHGCPKPKKP